MENEYKMNMTLTIRNISTDHFGGYRCVVRNSLGETDGLIRLYGTKLFFFSLFRSARNDFRPIMRYSEKMDITERESPSKASLVPAP